MAYAAQLINRMAQFGSAFYDLLVVDDAGLLPTFRSSVSWPVGNDAAASAAILAAAAQTATDFLRDMEIAANLVQAINQGTVTFNYSTPTQNITAVRMFFSQLSGWQAVCLANYISSLGLTNAQYTTFFGYSGAALTTFKNKLAAAVVNYNNVIATQGQ